MSQHKYYDRLSGKEVLFGWDAPTGGFFITIFEGIDDENVILEKIGITLTELHYVFKNNFDRRHFPDYKILINEALHSSLPTKFQINIAKNIFNVDVMEKIDICFDDLIENFCHKMDDEQVYILKAMGF